MWTRSFALSLLERAVKTFVQTLIAVWPVADGALGLLDVDWAKALSISGLAALLSVLTSIASGPIGPDNSPSLVGEPPQEPAAVLGDEAEENRAAAAGVHELDGVGRNGQPEISASEFPPPSATEYRGPRG